MQEPLPIYFNADGTRTNQAIQSLMSTQHVNEPLSSVINQSQANYIAEKEAESQKKVNKSDEHQIMGFKTMVPQAAHMSYIEAQTDDQFSITRTDRDLRSPLLLMEKLEQQKADEETKSKRSSIIVDLPEKPAKDSIIVETVEDSSVGANAQKESVYLTQLPEDQQYDQPKTETPQSEPSAIQVIGEKDETASLNDPITPVTNNESADLNNSKKIKLDKNAEKKTLKAKSKTAAIIDRQPTSNPAVIVRPRFKDKRHNIGFSESGSLLGIKEKKTTAMTMDTEKQTGG